MSAIDQEVAALVADRAALTPPAINVRQVILDLLSRRDHSKRELTQKLRQRGALDAHIEVELAWAEQQGYLSEMRFAQMLLRTVLQKGYGLAYYRQLCQQHQLDNTLLQQSLAEQEPDWFDTALQVYQKKYGRATSAAVEELDFKERQKRMAFLQRRGFSSEQIRYVMQHSED
jgi:regulatory protein